MINMFIGFDQVESVAYNVFAYSINRQSSVPVSVTPVYLKQLPTLTRARDPKQSNEFAFSRWMVPHMCDYTGWAIFADCDMLSRSDIAELWALRDDRYAVMVVKHDHIPREETKYLGAKQSAYPKKNWSSVMLINCAKCKALTPEYVNTAHGLDLHQFKWLESEDLIGELPVEWNHLVGYYPPNKNAKIVHWTIGGPYFHDYALTEFADEWHRDYRAMIHCNQIISGPLT